MPWLNMVSHPSFHEKTLAVMTSAFPLQSPVSKR